MQDVGTIVSQRLLSQANMPGQYIGMEINARCGDVHKAAVTVALAFPDTYTIGISHLGSQVLYHRLNSIPSVACDRTYCPPRDGEEIMRRESVPLFGWESRCAISDFDILGFSLTYEMCITNVLTMLDLADIELHSNRRTDRDPIVIAGDALADSPEPLADFIDIFISGDGEEPLSRLVELVGKMKSRGACREEIILEAAQKCPSTYVPRFYEPRRVEGAAFMVPHPIRDDVPAVVPRAAIAKLSDSPSMTAPLVPLAEAVQERVIIEVMRGCPNGCRFCQAGATRLPVRFRGIDEIVNIARAAIDATGYREISLLSLSTSDYPHLNELIDRLGAEFSSRHVSISLPSLRVDSQLRQLPKLTSTVRKGGLTIAAEAGSERLRKAIRKNITEENMLAGVKAAYEAGWQKVKVYFMAGFPGETQADIDAIFDLCIRLSNTRKQVDNQRGAISASVSWLVPKPHTPMQWCPMRDSEYFFSVRNRLLDLSRRSPVTFKFHRIERSILEAVICRGDRKIGAVIEAAWRNGARMDAWNEEFDYQKWANAFEQTGIDPANYAHHQLPLEAPLPWSHIQCHRNENFLRTEYHKMIETLNQ